ncbi:general substrate transporter [Atractiella rhizophila]|nr:general substrate transporter [Atractiella rhizophila]
MPSRDSLAIYGISLFVSISGLCFGFDTGSIAPVTLMPSFEKKFSPDRPLSEIVRGLIVSSILITATIFGILAGPLSDRFSRKYTISLGGGVFAIGSALAAAADGLPLLFVGRLIAGAGEGLFLSTASIYVIEIAPLSLRGRLQALIQVMINVGIPAGFFICYALQRALPHSALSWRLVFVFQAIFASIMAIGAPFLPYSPRWLRMQGRVEEAREVLDRLHKKEAEVEKEEILNAVQVQGNVSFKELFSKMNRGRTILACYLFASQQLCGIDAVLYYAPVVFANAGLSATTSSLIASGVTGIVLLLVVIFVAPFMDRLGRRTLAIYGGITIAFSLFMQGILYASKATNAAGARWTVIAMIEVFIVAFAASWGVGMRMYISEIQSGRTRAAATSLATATNQGVNFLIALTTPLFLAASSSGPYFLFGSTTTLAVIICLLYMPETRGVSLENIDKAFQDHVHLKRWKARLHSLSCFRNGKEQASPESEDESEPGVELPVVERTETEIPKSEVVVAA